MLNFANELKIHSLFTMAMFYKVHQKKSNPGYFQSCFAYMIVVKNEKIQLILARM